MLQFLILKKWLLLSTPALLFVSAGDVCAAPMAVASAQRVILSPQVLGPELPTAQVSRNNYDLDNNSAEFDSGTFHAHNLKAAHPRFGLRLPLVAGGKTIEEAPSIEYTSRLAEQAVFPRSPPVAS